ncbi:MAG: sugar phosphate nucleotidyltransferase [Bacteroidia bacterium]
MKVVIPVAGTGYHLRPHTYTQPKPLIPIAGKPLLGHIVDTLIEAGWKEFIFVIGYLGEKIRSYIEATYAEHIPVHFIFQPQRLGSAHALSLCSALLEGDSRFLIVLGDTLVQMNWQHLWEASETIVGLARVSNPGAFGVAEIDEKGYVRHLVEKPTIPRSNMALVGVYKISDTALFWEGIRYTLTNHILSHGEYQLTDVLVYMLEKGASLRGVLVDKWLDCERKEVLLEANRWLLRGQNTIFHEPAYTVIIPPVYIPPSCRIYGSIIGPYVTLGEETEVQNSILEDSILGSHTQVRNMILRKSIVGSDSILVGKAHALNIGDNTTLDFA